MSETLDFRNWAARVAGQASQERNPSEAQRLRSIAGFGNGSPTWKTGRVRVRKPQRPRHRLRRGRRSG